MNRTARSTLALSISLALALAALALMSGCGSQAAEAQSAPPAPEVSVATVTSTPVQQWDAFTGRVAAVETVELTPRVSGYVEKVNYQEGQEVQAGDVLFVIDERRYRAEYNRAVADLERSRSEARLAQSQDARAQRLIDARAISAEEFDLRKSATAQTLAAVRAAEAAVERARLDLEFTQVRAPISGRAGRAQVTVGNLARADATVLTTLVSMDPMHVYFEADEQTYLRLAKLTDGHSTSAGTAVRVGLSDEQGYPHEGVLDFFDPQVDARTGTIRGRARVSNADRSFTPGLFARLQLAGVRDRTALLIDERAVLTDQDRKYVYVLDESNAAQRRDVVLGRASDGLRVVEQGLSAGDHVIVHGLQKVFYPGMTVDPRPIEMGADAAFESVAAH